MSHLTPSRDPSPWNAQDSAELRARCPSELWRERQTVSWCMLVMKNKYTNKHPRRSGSLTYAYKGKQMFRLCTHKKRGVHLSTHENKDRGVQKSITLSESLDNIAKEKHSFRLLSGSGILDKGTPLVLLFQHSTASSLNFELVVCTRTSLLGGGDKISSRRSRRVRLGSFRQDHLLPMGVGAAARKPSGIFAYTMWRKPRPP